jgi:hypothetical protein
MAGNVRIVNRNRDRVFFELDELEADGTPKRAGGKPVRKKIVLGSTDDEGTVGVEQPEITIPGDEWDRLLKQKAVQGMIDKRHIVVYPA